MSRMQNPENILERIDWKVIRRLDGILQGDYRTVFHGFGLDLAELREYQFNDDVRSIDWNVTARMQTPYVRQFNEERELTAWFLLDLSPSVDFGTALASKRAYLIDFTTLIARLLTRHGNRVGAILSSGDGEYVIPPQGGKPQVLRLINELQTRPYAEDTGFTNLGFLLTTAHKLIRRRSLVFVVSDFISVPGWESVLGLLTMRHETLAIRLFDPREKEMPAVGTVLFQDSETGEQILVDTSKRRFRRRFAEAADRREQELMSALNRTGTDLLNLSTESDLVEEVITFAARRKRLGARSGGKHVVSMA